MGLLDDRLKDQLDYSIALQRAIWYHCQGEEVMPHVAEKYPHHARMLNKSLRGHAKEASEVLYELVEKLQARVNRLERLAEGKLLTDREIFAGLEAANVRLNAQAEDITELTRRIETLEQEHTKLNCHLGEMAGLWNSADVSLARRIEALAVAQAGNDRTFRELIGDKAELALRVEKLRGKSAVSWEFLAELVIALEKRIEQLERLLERE